MQDRRRGGKITMGYPIEMIGANTVLFSLVGENAIEEKNEALFNEQFKKLDVDCKMMPLNIRRDDFGYFLNGLKDSQIKGTYFEPEYWQQVFELLPCEDEEINFCGICDTIDIENAQYKMRLSVGEAIVSSLGEITGKTIIIYGATSEAKSTLFHLIKQKPSMIILAEEVVEELISMMHLIPKEIEHDIIRIDENRQINTYDKVLNFTDLKILSDIDFHHDRDKIYEIIAALNTNKWSKNE